MKHPRLRGHSHPCAKRLWTRLTSWRVWVSVGPARSGTSAAPRTGCGAPHLVSPPPSHTGCSPGLRHWLLPRPPAGSATVAEPADRAPLPQHQRLEQRQPPQGTQTPLFLADQLSRSPGRRSSCGNCRSKARFAETAKIGRRRSRPRIRGHGSSKDLCNNCDVGAATEHRDKARHRSGAQAKAQARLQSQPKPKPKLRQKPTLRHDPTPKR